ncbi:MAG: ATP-binding cassette domain-containing protein [Acidimicrobiia bacterium]|nr:ATP-binding cassette domain-containing protein [Acidimicrobiia bacterium]
MEIAFRSSRALARAEAQLDQSKAQSDQLRSALMPQLNLSLNDTLQTVNLRAMGIDIPFAPSRVGPFQSMDARALLTQNVFNWGVVERNRAGRARTQAAVAIRDNARELLAMQVAVAFAQALRAQSAAQTLELQRGLSRQLGDIARAREASRPDPAAASSATFGDALLALAAQGMTIVVATPYLDEAEKCTRVALMERGRILEIDTPANFRSSLGWTRLELETPRLAAAREALSNTAVQDVQRFGDRLDVLVQGAAAGEAEIRKTLDGAGVEVRAIRRSEPTLENAFVARLRRLRHTPERSLFDLRRRPLDGEVLLEAAGLEKRFGDFRAVKDFHAVIRLYGVPDAVRRARREWVLNISELAGQEKLLTGKLPGGWKQRVAFGAAILHEPDLIFLDEPTSGVDPLARRVMWSMIHGLADAGAGVLVVTHYMEEAGQCNRIGFMVAGELAAEGTPGEVKTTHGGANLDEVFFTLASARGRAA